jgi:hypothetical protein
MARINIEIKNWDRFNGRKDIKQASWFRLNNSIFEDADFFDFSHSELMFWIYLLSLASKKQSGQILLNTEHAYRIGRFDERTLKESIEKLVRLDCITCSDKIEVETRARNVDVTSASVEHERSRTLQDKTNKQNKQNNIGQMALAESEPMSHFVAAEQGENPPNGTVCPKSFDELLAEYGQTVDSHFEQEAKRLRVSQATATDYLAQIYRDHYPRKEKKSEGLKRLVRHIKHVSDVVDFYRAVVKFRDHHRLRGTEKQFLPHFSTFVGAKGLEWRDWLDPATGQAEDFSRIHSGVDEALERIRLADQSRQVGASA